MAQGGTADMKQFLNIPVSIVLGILLGAVVGYLLSLFFETAYAKAHYVRNSMKVMIVLGVSFLLMAVETWVKAYVSVSGLLAVVSMACVLKIKCPNLSQEDSRRNSESSGSRRKLSYLYWSAQRLISVYGDGRNARRGDCHDPAGIGVPCCRCSCVHDGNGIG